MSVPWSASPVQTTRPVKIRIVASVSAFPTIPAAGGGLILDEEPLQQTLLASGALPLQATQWWLRAAAAPDFSGIATGLQAISRTAVAAAMTANPFDADVRLALIAIAAAAVILAIAGFAVGAAAARERRPELALLDALGWPAQAADQDAAHRAGPAGSAQCRRPGWRSGWYSRT